MLLLGTQWVYGLSCPADSSLVGETCVDKYEASVWEIPPTSTSLIKKVKKGTVTLTNLMNGGAIQRGVSSDDYGTVCPDTAAGCTNLYAVSIAGVTPSRFINWFQAQAACGNAGKELIANSTWQLAAFGTPDGPPCVVNSVPLGPTWTPGCVSDRGHL
jgi:hypothetical protein